MGLQQAQQEILELIAMLRAKSTPALAMPVESVDGPVQGVTTTNAENLSVRDNGLSFAGASHASHLLRYWGSNQVGEGLSSQLGVEAIEPLQGDHKTIPFGLQGVEVSET